MSLSWYIEPIDVP